MLTTTASDSPPRAAAWLNLAVPGAGLILIGRARIGLVTGFAFALSANLAVASRLLIPDDVPTWAQNLAILTACVIYIAAQALLLSSPSGASAGRIPDRVRRAALGEIERLVAVGDFEVARSVIDANHALAREDVHIAFRRAQVLTEINAADAADAWRKLAALDRHDLYRSERLAGLRRLGDSTATTSGEP